MHRDPMRSRRGRTGSLPNRDRHRPETGEAGPGPHGPPPDAVDGPRRTRRLRRPHADAHGSSRHRGPRAVEARQPDRRRCHACAPAARGGGGPAAAAPAGTRRSRLRGVAASACRSGPASSAVGKCAIRGLRAGRMLGRDAVRASRVEKKSGRVHVTRPPAHATKGRALRPRRLDAEWTAGTVLERDDVASSGGSRARVAGCSVRRLKTETRLRGRSMRPRRTRWRPTAS